VAEIEIGVFARQCWDRRIGDKATLVRETQALEAERNAAKATIRWQFTADLARERLQRLFIHAIQPDGLLVTVRLERGGRFADLS